LFCRCWNFKWWICSANSRVGQPWAIIDQMSALWMINLMLMLDWSLLNREQTLASIVSVCTVHISLSVNDYMIYKMHVPFVQYKMSLTTWSTYMREVHGLIYLHWFLCFSAKKANKVFCGEGVIYIKIIQGNRQDRTFYPCLYFSWCAHFAFNQNVECYTWKRRGWLCWLKNVILIIYTTGQGAIFYQRLLW
jgi:hypothetical protein